MFFLFLDNGAVAAISLLCIGIILSAIGFWARKYPNGNVSIAYQWIWCALKIAGFEVAFAMMKIVQCIFNNLCAKCTQHDDRRNLLEIPMDNVMPLAGINIQQPYPDHLNP